MGRDEILQQTPLKTPLDRTKYARQSFTPHYDHSSINLSLLDRKQSHLTSIKKRDFKSLKI
ncbi:hypothetical protein EC589_07305 [Helicobacter pylori]|nr:hypothetical protein EC589_07305 [Helicobacter pylori]